MQRHAAFAIPLGTRDFDTVQTARAHDLDALSTQTHRVLHRTLHRTAEHDPALELLRDRISDQLRIRFRLADFFDVDVNRNAHALLQLGLQQFNVFTLLADHDTRTRAENRDTRVLCRTLDHNAADGRVLQLLLQVFTNTDVFLQHRREIVVVRVPTRSPIAADGQTEASRMNFLSHRMAP